MVSALLNGYDKALSEAPNAGLNANKITLTLKFSMTEQKDGGVSLELGSASIGAEGKSRIMNNQSFTIVIQDVSNKAAREICDA
jgi:uncharacterized protein YpmS